MLTKATDSALLSIEHFNRPWDRGRHEAVLILIDRSFELLLKAVIVYKGGKIREPRAKETIGFDVVFNTGIQILYIEKRVPAYLSDATKIKMKAIIDFVKSKFLPVNSG